MVVNMYYVFQPTPHLLAALEIAKEEWLGEISVWSTKDHDRIGSEYSRTEIETAFWIMFLTKLVGEDPELRDIKNLRETCLKLGFAGCWSAHLTRLGGPATELIEEASETELCVRRYVLGE